MCRAKACGGRRCIWSTGAKADHNRRRRENRAIRANLIAWMRGQEEVLGSDAGRLADELEAMQPGQIKGWLKAHNVDPSKFKDEVPDKRVNPQFGRQPAHVRPADFIAGNRRPASAADERSMSPAVHAPADEPGPAAAAPAGEKGFSIWSAGVSDEFREQVIAIRRGQGAHRDERSLLAGEPVISELAQSGTNETYRVQFDNGMVGYFKSFDGLNDQIAGGFGQTEAEQCVHEAAAWQLAREMGPPYADMVPPVVIRQVNGKPGSLAAARSGTEGRRDPWHVPEWPSAAFFDAVIGQQDRHPDNYLVAGDRLALIDHGYTFARPGDFRNFSWFAQHRTATSPLLSHDERALLERLAHSKDLLGVADMVSPGRAEAMRGRIDRMRASGKIEGDY